MSERLHKCTQVEYCSKLIEIESISQDDRLEFYDELSPHILYHPQQKVSYPIRVAKTRTLPRIKISAIQTNFTNCS